MTKYIVVCGGVISGVGKGVATASIGRILKEYGYSVTAIKIDPYLNVSASTLRPTEHGEVWVTDDGGEIDQDLGNYERFLDMDIPKKNCMTSGQIYKTIIEREMKGDYLGKTVQFIPHVPEEIKRRIKDAAQGFDVALIEIGGTIGDYENIPFLFATKSLERELGKENVTHILVTYLPVPKHVAEMKTKPTQTAIKLLTEHGIVPDFIICRSQYPMDEVRKKKIETYANIGSEYVISAPDIKNTIYAIPLNFEKEQLGKKILKKLNLEIKQQPDWTAWQEKVDVLDNHEKEVNIAMVGKYIDSGDFTLNDSYISVNQALHHAAAANGVGVKITWVDAKLLEDSPQEVENLQRFDGILVPGGFGSTGVEGKIKAIQCARENNIPFLGLCYGLQLAIIEFARNVCDLSDAHSTEIDENTKHPVIDILPEQKNISTISGTLRLGAYAATIKPESKVYHLYNTTGRLTQDQKRIEEIKHNGEKFRIANTPQENTILERHRHRFEQNPEFIDIIQQQGLLFSGHHEREDGTKLMEFIELPNHPFYISTQAHPEFKSRLLDPSPLFLGFIKAAKNQQK
jgi:CTP synthase